MSGQRPQTRDEDVRSALVEQLEELPADLAADLSRSGFDRAWFVDMASRVGRGHIDNRVTGVVEPPRPGDIVDLPPPGSPDYDRLEKAGTEAIASGKCALAVLAGGMATRMGGVVKALVEALPGRTFLDLRLQEQNAREVWADREIPLWLMTSHATETPIRAALAEKLDGYRIATFRQGLSLRLTPAGELFMGDDGRPSEHAPGHGDLPEALRSSGLLEEFVARGGEQVTVANLDNLGATIDPVVIGLHMERNRPVTCEVVNKSGSDKGGIPARLDGRPVILEDFRVPSTFDPSLVGVFNTNTFHLTADALATLDIDWTYNAVEKEVDGRSAIQFERLINEVTHHLDTTFVRVPRQGPDSHYLPVKDDDELERRRGELEVVARRRGMID